MAAKHITLIVTGSVAAVKTFQLIDQLQQAGYEADIVVTKAVWEHQFFASPKYKPTDSQLADLRQRAIAEDDDTAIRAAFARSEKILVCPASADFISQIAHASSPLGALLKNTQTPVLIAPAMNVMMWQHPAVAQNVALLDHAHFIGPALGRMACGDQGYGRMVEPHTIVSQLDRPDASLFEKAKIHDALLPQHIEAHAKNILLMVHHNQDDEALRCAQSLVDKGFNVQCMLTPQSQDAAHELHAITGNPPIWEHYQRDPQGMEHIRLPEQNDAVIVAPTSEAYLSEMARGASASLCGCTYLATKKPVIILAQHSPHLPALQSHGATIISDLSQLHLKEHEMTQELEGKNILVWAGNPRERVDNFRFYVNDTITLPPTLAHIKQLQEAGANVTIIVPASNKLRIAGANVIDTLADGKEIESARHMLAASEQAGAAQHFDMVLQLSGLSSIACEKPSSSKIQKTGPNQQQLFDVIGNIDIARKLQAAFPEATIAGFDQYQQWFGNPALKPHPVHAAPQEPAAKPQALPRSSGKFAGKHVVVTTSRTEEILTDMGDKITNFFSGRQGQAVAESFAQMGARVTLVSGPTHLPDVAHPQVKTIHTRSSREMHAVCMQLLDSTVDVFVGAGAIADFGNDAPAPLRLKEGQRHKLELGENPSIVGDTAHHANRPQIVVSFAAQSPETILEYAQKKFTKLGVELTVANPIGDNTIAFKDPTQNQVFFITKEGVRALPEMSKKEVAQEIAAEVSRLFLKSKAVTPADRNDPPASAVGR